jgi:NAD(P)-dependent dehydrogenase (short-subunit alcohol dehydrogenase family)
MSPEDRFSVRDRVVLITGASRGIGHETAVAFAEAGARLVLASRSPGDLEGAAAAIRQRGVQALAVEADVTSSSSVDRLVAEALAAFGRIDVLINNAGVYLNRPALETTEGEWDLMTDTNLKGVFFASCRVARAMIEQQDGRIINISSALSLVAQRGYACYGATKAGLQQLTRVLALEWASSNVTVNAIAPTSTVTPQTAERLSTPAALAQAQERIPLGRFCRSDDVIGAALYLASPAGGFVTGQTLYVDGGLGLP